MSNDTITGTALVTGASRGIGRATALELHERGWDVIATARDPRTLDGLPMKRLGALDVTDDASVTAAAAEWPDVDVLINNAGIGAAGPVESTPIAVAHDIFEVNVFGALRTVAAFAPGMRARGRGTIVNVSSLVGRIATPLAGVYAASARRDLHRRGRRPGRRRHPRTRPPPTARPGQRHHHPTAHRPRHHGRHRIRHHRAIRLHPGRLVVLRAASPTSCAP